MWITFGDTRSLLLCGVLGDEAQAAANAIEKGAARGEEGKARILTIEERTRPRPRVLLYDAPEVGASAR